MTFWSNTSDVIQPFLTRCDCWHRRLTTTSCYSTDQWCSGKYLLGGTDGERGARAYNAVLGAEPQRGPRAEPRWGSGGRSPPEAEKVLRFGHAMKTANLPYNSLYFGNWVNRCIRDLSPKLRCNRCSGVQVQSNSVYAVKNFSCWTATIWGMNRYSRQQGNRVYNFLVRCAI